MPFLTFTGRAAHRALPADEPFLDAVEATFQGATCIYAEKLLW